jgi:hypothetical protein
MQEERTAVDAWATAGAGARGAELDFDDEPPPHPAIRALTPIATAALRMT